MQKGALCVLGCYVFWGTLPIFWKQLDAVDSIYILGCRIVWSVVFAASSKTEKFTFATILVVLQPPTAITSAALRDSFGAVTSTNVIPVAA
jgi:EamA domain-containing membrane protein RarD